MKTLHKISFLFLCLALFTSSCKKDDDKEEEVDLCETVVCQNGGTCDNGDCDCASGYEGSNCEVESRTKYIGTYDMTAMTEDCDDITVVGQTINPGTFIPATDPYSLEVTADPNNINGLILTNIDDPDAFTAVVTVNAVGAITIESQEVGEQVVQGNTIVVSASGTGQFSLPSIQLDLIKTRAVDIPLVGSQTATCTQVQNGSL